jgi:formate--tetrahydrofolate ligase
MSEVWEHGGNGGKALAEEVVRLCEKPSDFRYSYELDSPITEKIEAVVRRVYGGDGADFEPRALTSAKRLESFGFGTLPVCMAKTQYSFPTTPR